MTRKERDFGLSLAWFTTMAGVALGVGLAALGLPLEGGAMAVFAFAFVYVRMDRTLTPGLLIGPSSFAFLFHAMGYSFGPLAQRYILGEEAFIEEGMILAQWGAVLGLTTYAIVYHKVFQTVVYRLDKNAKQNTTLTGFKWEGYAVSLMVISVFILFYGYVSGGSRRIGGLDTDVSALTGTLTDSFWYAQIIVFFFLGFLAVKRRGWWIALAAISYLAYAGFQTLEGSRGPLLSSLLMLATGAVLAGYSKKKTFLAIGLSSLLFIPLAGVVDFYRSYTKLSQYEEGFFERILAFSGAMQDLHALEKEGSRIANRAFIYAISAITVDRVMDMTPDVIPYAGFENLDAILYTYIPVVIAPDRPEIKDGNIIAAIYGIGKGTKSTYFYIPSVGEGYRRFGWLGIPSLYGLSGIIFGATLAVCWAKRQRREWAAMLVFLVIQAPAAWSFTFNYLFYFSLLLIPKYFIYFAVLSKLHDVITSLHRSILRPSLVKRSGGTSLQGWSS